MADGRRSAGGNARVIVPVIDLAPSFSPEKRERVSVARAIAEAARTTGVFFASNHGVPDSLVASHFAMAREFFGLSFEEKCAIDVKRSSSFRGYEPFGTQTIDATAPGDLKEGFIMGPDLDADHPHVVARYPNTGANLWPSRPIGFREQFETYVAAMNQLGRHLSRSLALSLELPEDYFVDGLREPLTYSQMFHYPPVSDDTSPRIGAGAHVDWGMLTLLLQDNVGGLEVRRADDVWVPAPPVPGTLVVILGEMMLRFTGGAYRSATHRVAKNVSGRSRYSMPTFFDPAYDYRVACVPSCLPATGEPRFTALTVAEHMRQMSRETLSTMTTR